MMDNKYFQLLRKRNQFRFWITIFTIILFLCIVVGVLYALIVGTPIAAAWKEILLLLLGAFIGAYGRTIDFWFNDSEKDIELMRHSIQSDNIHKGQYVVHDPDKYENQAGKHESPDEK